MLAVRYSITHCTFCFENWLIVNMPKYAVAVGHKPGIYDTWGDCSAQVKGFKGAKYKKFDTIDLAEAFLRENGAKSVRKRLHIDDSDDTPDGPTCSMECDEGPVRLLAENINPPSLMRISKISPSDVTAFNLSARLTSLEDKFNSYVEKTSKLLDSLSSRITKLEGGNVFASNSANDQVFSKKFRSDGCVSKNNENGHVSVTAEGFSTSANGFVCVYTDGACSSNGRDGAKAGIGVWFNHKHPLNVSEPVKGPPTNNTAEIQAARVAIQQASKGGVRNLSIHTDSKFVIDCITKWIHRWKKNGWKLSTGGPVKNKNELQKLDKAIQYLDAVEWVHVRGHRGIMGNEMADNLARDGAVRYNSNIRYADHVDGEDLDYLEKD